MASSGKEKKAKEGRDEASFLLRQLMEEMASLRSEVETIKAGKVASAKSKLEASDNEGTAPDLSPETDASIARLGYAFSSVQKVAILRILLTDGSQTSAQIGEKAQLTTGSLYHHLRELAHAGVIESSGRNQHVITPLGKRAISSLAELAG